jgi:5-methylcytosine-specific restriction endonuclease McrA
MKRKIFPKEEIDRVKQLRSEGLSYDKIGLIVGFNGGTVRRVLDTKRTKEDRLKEYKVRITRTVKTKIELGGKCSVCGYNKSINALQFHHVEEKSDFLKKHKNFEKLNEEGFKNEIKKCVLVCANCHVEIHDEMGKRPFSTSIYEKINSNDIRKEIIEEIANLDLTQE